MNPRGSRRYSQWLKDDLAVSAWFVLQIELLLREEKNKTKQKKTACTCTMENGSLFAAEPSVGNRAFIGAGGGIFFGLG